MEECMCNYKENAKRISWILILPIISIIYVYLNNNTLHANSVELELDRMIPFVSIFVIPYLYWYIYVFAGLVFFAMKNKEAYKKLMLTIVISMLCCYSIYYFFPTTVVRPKIVNINFMNQLVKFVYSMDKPYNCFPSIHILNLFLVSLFFYRYNKNKFFKIFISLNFIMISLSILFVKQHYVLDILSAILLAMVVYLSVTVLDYYANIDIFKRVVQNLKTYKFCIRNSKYRDV